MKRWTTILGVGALLAVGCGSTKTEKLDCGSWLAGQDTVADVVGEVASDVAPEVVLDLATPDGSPDESAGLPLASGSACTNGDECFTKECFCGEEVTPSCFDLKGFATGLGLAWEYVLTGGMCSKLWCNPKKPEACGDGAFCFDVGPLFQATMVIGLCLAYCEEFDDCRYQEGYLCYFTGVEGQRACLPESIVKDVPCGNELCETGENATMCPRDCFCGNGTCDSDEDNASCGEDCK